MKLLLGLMLSLSSAVLQAQTSKSSQALDLLLRLNPQTTITYGEASQSTSLLLAAALSDQTSQSRIEVSNTCREQDSLQICQLQIYNRDLSPSRIDSTLIIEYKVDLGSQKLVGVPSALYAD